MGSKKKLCDAMRWAADSDQVGYSQSDRDSLGPDDFFGEGLYNTDCSKLTVVALQHAGFDTAWASYTGNMSDALTSRGWERLSPYVDLEPGDILLNDGSHVAVWLGDCLSQASIDENGNIAGGARGDQSGWEVNTSGWYDYPWRCILRWPYDDEEDEEKGEPVQLVVNDGGDVYRLYNPNSGYHHLTLDAKEKDSLVELGWKYEGVAFVAPRGGVHAVYRMYNKKTGDHVYTPDHSEAVDLQTAGWIYEGVPFFAQPGGTGSPVYRMFNPNSNEHFYTSDDLERMSLIENGWVHEGGFTV